MPSDVTDFGKTAIRFARNPLGIIALFIVLVYGIAALFLAFTGNLSEMERLPLIYFLAVFPILVLIAFSWLVSRHAPKLYAPGDYDKDESYLAAIASLAAAGIKDEEAPGGVRQQPNVDVKKVAEQVRHVATSAAVARAPGETRILWVDDHPENNALVRQAFEALGIATDIALSTAQATETLKYRNFAAIVSDLGRKEGPNEGLTLLESLRAQGDHTPYFIYAGPRALQQAARITELGGNGSTNNPRELFEMVTRAVLARARS